MMKTYELAETDDYTKYIDCIITICDLFEIPDDEIESFRKQVDDIINNVSE